MGPSPPEVENTRDEKQQKQLHTQKYTVTFLSTTHTIKLHNAMYIKWEVKWDWIRKGRERDKKFKGHSFMHLETFVANLWWPILFSAATSCCQVQSLSFHFPITMHPFPYLCGLCVHRLISLVSSTPSSTPSFLQASELLNSLESSSLRSAGS